MTSIVITGIGELVTCDGTGADGLGIQTGAAVVVNEERIAWIGPAASAPAADRQVDLDGRTLIPGFVDSHSHLVFAGDRAAEFVARMAGEPYDGGGIASTVDATRSASAEELAALVAGRVAEMRAQGTTTVEIKSGYGLSVSEEVRSLLVARQFTTETTFLGAHVVPPEWQGDRAGYLDLITGPMLAAAAPLARWIDVFCEPGSPHAFGVDEARAVLLAGRAAGLGLRLHGNQLGPGPGVQLAVELGAASVDHCTYLSRRRFGRPGRRRRDNRRHVAARRRVLHPLPLPRRCPALAGRRLGCAGHRLQPGNLLLVLDVVHDRPGRTRDGPDPGPGLVRRNGRLRAIAAAH